MTDGAAISSAANAKGISAIYIRRIISFARIAVRRWTVTRKMFEIDASTTRRIVGQLMDIRAALMDNNDLSLKVARRGWIAAINGLDMAIEMIVKLESKHAMNERQLADNAELLTMYDSMLGGYDGNTLTDERKAELKALVDKWQKEDETE